MAQRAYFSPSVGALAFGDQYAMVLARWGELFATASALVEANVELGRMTSDAGKEFDKWVRNTAAAPWAWLDPSVMQKFAEAFRSPSGGRSE